MLKLVRLLWVFVFSLLLIGCSGELPPDTIRVGTIAGPETDLMETARQYAAENFGLNIKIVEFDDYLTPNIALNDGSIEANVYQHAPYLDHAISARGWPLLSVGRTFVYPMGIYANRYQNIEQLSEGDTVGIPNDPSNGGRALLLMASAGFITLKPLSALQSPSPRDIIDNPLRLRFVELDAAQLPRALDDLDVAAINTNFALLANLTPEQALLREAPDSPYANLIVTRQDFAADERIAKLVAALQSPAVLSKAELLFKGHAIKAW